MKTIEYWHPKRGIGGPALEDSTHAFQHTIEENEMELVIAIVQKYDEKRHFWVVRPLRPSKYAYYHLTTLDFDYEGVAVNDLVEIRSTESGYIASRHVVKAL